MDRLVGCLLIAACGPAATTVVPAEVPRVGDVALDPADAGVTDVRDVADFAVAVESGLEGRVDAQGVIFIDAWEDEGEEARPKIANVLCGAALEAQKREWIEDVRARLAQAAEGAEEYAFVCEAGTCVHEAAEGMDYRGEYRFARGILRVVAHTSGPPGHVTGALLSLDRRFVAAAVAALADAPCGTAFDAYPSYDPMLDGPE